MAVSEDKNLREFTLTAVFFVGSALTVTLTGVNLINVPLHYLLQSFRIFPGIIELMMIGLTGLWAAIAIWGTNQYYRRLVAPGRWREALIACALVLIAAIAVIGYLLASSSLFLEMLQKTTL